jgi:diguanylate cyclase (GGDEF)-like protein
MPSLRTRILLPVVALVLAGVVYGAAAIQRSTATRSADRVQTAQDLLTGMLDQETGLRGFLLSGRSGFLAPYVAGTRHYEEALSLAHVQLARNRDAARAVAHADAIAERWRVLAEDAIADTRATGVHTQPRDALLERKRLMDAFRGADDALHATLVSQRERDQRLALWLSVGLSLAVFLLVGGVGTIVVTRRVRAHMAAAEAENEYRGSQAEFVQTLQAVDSEQEANVLLQRHIRQWTPDREVVVANRNNSDNRLETSGDGDGALREALDTAEPRACVAIRLGRAHEQRAGEQGLLSCELCGAGGDALCSPLVISGRVIGSVAVRQPEPFDDATRRRIADSVSQAAPVVGNLRAVAMAETRAATDALTGLPNRRAVADTLKRMSAQAQRTGHPLAALALDLDYFKDVNDRFGHDKGDEVLATVAQTMAATIRESDFAGRLGGEEFVIFAPNTGADGALILAEKVRAAIEGIEIAGVSRAITISIGVAVQPDDALDGEMLMRRADRALYAAKERGRNRVEAVVAGRRHSAAAR